MSLLTCRDLVPFFNGLISSIVWVTFKVNFSVKKTRCHHDQSERLNFTRVEQHSAKSRGISADILVPSTGSISRKKQAQYTTQAQWDMRCASSEQAFSGSHVRF